MNLSTDDLADLSGLTRRQVSLYSSAGVFGAVNIAPGSGRPRTFTATDILVAGVLSRLSDLMGALSGLGGGLSHTLARRVADAVWADPQGWLIMHPDGTLEVDTVALFPPSRCFVAVAIQDDGPW